MEVINFLLAILYLTRLIPANTPYFFACKNFSKISVTHGTDACVNPFRKFGEKGHIDKSFGKFPGKFYRNLLIGLQPAIFALKATEDFRKRRRQMAYDQVNQIIPSSH